MSNINEQREAGALALLNKLREIEKITERSARSIYVHHDEPNFDQRVANGAEEFPLIITQFGRWAITPDGLECLTQAYFIDAESLANIEFWIKHAVWNNQSIAPDDIEDFTTALYHARRIHQFLGERGDNPPD